MYLYRKLGSKLLIFLELKLPFMQLGVKVLFHFHVIFIFLTTFQYLSHSNTHTAGFDSLSLTGPPKSQLIQALYFFLKGNVTEKKLKKGETITVEASNHSIPSIGRQTQAKQRLFQILRMFFKTLIMDCQQSILCSNRQYREKKIVFGKSKEI